mmetsp:Transcript_68302/g.137365  ORF Transcript_68302/g.137365 Transcript_68302/m.137365 type:complete len:214 (-) Transcript_68302:994-1635(-)
MPLLSPNAEDSKPPAMEPPATEVSVAWLSAVAVVAIWRRKRCRPQTRDSRCRGTSELVILSLSVFTGFAFWNFVSSTMVKRLVLCLPNARCWEGAKAGVKPPAAEPAPGEDTARVSNLDSPTMLLVATRTLLLLLSPTPLTDGLLESAPPLVSDLLLLLAKVTGCVFGGGDDFSLPVRDLLLFSPRPLPPLPASTSPAPSSSSSAFFSLPSSS